MFENNAITKLLKIKYPIIQGGMAWVADADLAAAVSNGGGLGIIAAANMPPELLERQIQKIKTLTDKPFGLNIMLMSPTAGDALELAAKYRVFASIDQNGVGKLMKIAVELGRSTRPDIKLGICGEHGGDPASVKFCNTLGLTYVSCSPYRVPTARLAAAQAALEQE